MTDVSDLSSRFTKSLSLNLADKEEAKKIGERLRGVRIYWLCRSQAELAVNLGVSQKTVSNLEKGEVANPSISIETLQSVLKEHFDFVLYGIKSAKYYAFSPFINRHGVEFFETRWNITKNYLEHQRKSLKRRGPNYKKAHIGESLRLKIKKENKEFLEKQRMNKQKEKTS